MNPLSALFYVAVRVRNELYNRGSLTVRRLRGPVVSIGNLTVGGSGKTPFLVLLGGLLKKRGVQFGVLSRGYGRRTSGVALVDPEGSARDFGDEPLLIARKLGVPVVVGEDRFAAGQYSEEKFGSRLHLLDDGFQHRQLARDFDIVLVTAEDSGDSLMPVGRLREPLSSLRRADAIVLTDNSRADVPGFDNQHVWRARRGVVVPSIAGPSIAFCGIARPKQFFEQLHGAGIQLVATRSFRDHHAYTRADVQELVALRRQAAAAAFITTEKDAANLGPELASLEPIHLVFVDMQLEKEDAAVDALLNTIAERNNRSS